MPTRRECLLLYTHTGGAIENNIVTTSVYLIRKNTQCAHPKVRKMNVEEYIDVRFTELQ